MSESEITAREYFCEYVIRREPNWEESARRGKRLLDYFDAVTRSPEVLLPKEFRFPCREELAFAGDSTGEAMWGAGNDLLHPDAYLRIRTVGGVNRPRMQCVHFYACVKGKLFEIHARHRVIVLSVNAEDFLIGETF